jgi:hypothetical protein
MGDSYAGCDHKVRPKFVEHGEHFARVSGRSSTTGCQKLAHPNNRRLARVDNHTNLNRVWCEG